MFTLSARNVLLKPSHRRQLSNWMRRSLRLGRQLDRFDMTVTIERSGQCYEARADVHASAGDFACRCRDRDALAACRDLARSISLRLRRQLLQVASA